MNGGACTSCYTGYYLSGTNCRPLSNPYCSTYTAGVVCVNCYAGYYIEDDNLCVPQIKNCQTYNMTGGACLSCYAGYGLQNGNCTLLASIDPWCSIWNGLTCVSCYSGYYISLSTGKCTPANQQCVTYNMTGGACLSCRLSYILQNGNCLSILSINPWCTAYNTTSCTGCYPRYYLDTLNNNYCTLANPYCLSFNLIGGACNLCQWGHTLVNNTCK